MDNIYIPLLLIISIGFIIFSGVILKWHPFLSLLVAALGFGLFAGMAPVDVVKTIGNGFGSLIGAIGLIVVLGSVLGTVLEESGSVNELGNWVYQRAKRNPSLGMSFLGLVLGIPVFCDSGFIILVSLAKSVSVASGVPFSTMALSLSSGLYTSHTLVPPTPGPVAAAGNLGIDNSLGLVIILGILVSVPVVLIAHFYAKRIGSQLTIEIIQPVPTEQSIAGSIRYSIFLIALPVVLIALASVTDLLNVQGAGFQLLRFIGSPVIALLITVSLALVLFRSHSKSKLWIEKGIRQAGPILLLTGCGGALGAVLKASALSDLINGWAQDQALSGVSFLLAGFLISALFKTAQGSSTSALVIVSALLYPLVSGSGFTGSVELSLLVLAIGAGAMTVSHANDSYFWVVSQFSGFDLKSAYRGITIMTFLQGITALLMVLLFYRMLV
jgi:GntP family gluconate:H+ symporter